MNNKKKIKKLFEEFFEKVNNPLYRLKEINYYERFIDGAKKNKEVLKFVVDVLKKSNLPLKGINNILEKQIYVLIGGADGSEVIDVLLHTPIKHGILLEYDSGLCARALKKWESLHVPNKKLFIIGGDAMSNCYEVKKITDILFDKGEISGIIISCQSVLHELPFRSVKDYSHYKFLLHLIRDLPDVFFYSREPIGLREYNGEVQLSIPLIGINDLYKFATIIKEKLSFSSEIIKGINWISLDGQLAGEVIKKLVYFLENQDVDALLYELEENHSKFDSRDIYENVVCKLFNNNTPRLEYVNSDTFRLNFLDLDISIRAVNNAFPSGIIPKAFAIFTAWRSANLDISHSPTLQAF